MVQSNRKRRCTSASDDSDREPCRPAPQPPDSQPEKRVTRSHTRKLSEDEKAKLMPRVTEDFGHTVFPNEIWNEIMSFLSIEDLRELTLTCQTLRLIANEILWYSPSFKHPLRAEDFESLKYHPIQILHTYDLQIRKKTKLFAKIFQEMPSLKELKVCNNGYCYNNISMATLKIIAPFVTKITTGGIACHNRTEFVEQITKIDFPKLESVSILDKVSIRLFFWFGDHAMDRKRQFNLEDLQLMNRMPIKVVRCDQLQPDIEFDGANAWMRSIRRLSFPQFEFFFQMKSLRKVIIAGWVYNEVSKLWDIPRLKKLRIQNGVELRLSQNCGSILRQAVLRD